MRSWYKKFIFCLVCFVTMLILMLSVANRFYILLYKITIMAKFDDNILRVGREMQIVFLTNPMDKEDHCSGSICCKQ